jgi:hypothetical protein
MNSSKNRSKKAAFRSPKPVALCDSLHRRLNGYALAAGAAGVAALACSPQAEAAPVCKTLSARILGSNTFPFNPARETFPPFQIAQTTFGFYSSAYARLFLWNRGFFTPNSLGANVLLGKSNLPANLAAGASIGPGGKFGKGGSYGLMFTYGVGSPYNRHHGTLQNHQGNLNLQGTDYIGFRFSHAGDAHYGWARLQVTIQKGYVGKNTAIHVLGYGYESTPNTAIAAGSCSTPERSDADTNKAPSLESRGASLGMLALGGEGMARWRKPPF